MIALHASSSDHHHPSAGLRKRNEAATGGDTSNDNPWLEGLRFERHVILPLLGRRYVQPAIEVAVSADFVAAVAREVEPVRPPRRREHALDARLSTALPVATLKAAIPASSLPCTTPAQSLLHQLALHSLFAAPRHRPRRAVS